MRRHRWPGFSAGVLPGGGGHRHAGPGRLRRRGLQQSPAADHPQHQGRGAVQDRFGDREARRAESLPERRAARDHAHQRERARDHLAVRHRRRRHRQFSHPLSRQRCLRADRQAKRLRVHLPLRGPGQRLRHRAGSVLPLPLSGAASAGTRSLLRRRRCARHPARPGWRNPGDRSDQADPRQRRAADRPPAAGELARHAASASSSSGRIRTARCAARTPP